MRRVQGEVSMAIEDGVSRYSRQQLFRPIGQAGQARLQNARVAVVGMGALGTAMATQLVRAGIGYVRLIDRDIIEPSNLQRQTLYDEVDAAEGMPKAQAARLKLVQANSEVDVQAVVADVTPHNAESLLADVDVILDGTDNFQIRYLINDVAIKHNIPWAYGGAVSSYGTTGFLIPGQTPCLVCLFGPHTGGGHDTCDTVGVIAPIVAIIASLQVAETLKFLTGNTTALAAGLTYIDVWTNTFRTVGYPTRDGNCACCGQREFTSLNAQSDSLTVSMCGRQTIQVRPQSSQKLSLSALALRLAKVGTVHQNDYLLRCDLGDAKITLFPDGRALIHGTDDATAARSIYARYIGM